MRGIKTDKKPPLTVKNRHETDMRPKRVRMRNIHVSLYYRNRPDKNGTAPLLLAINYAGSSTYVPVGNVRLRPDQLSKIATQLSMREIDLITYPEIYVSQKETKDENVEVVLQMRLKKDKKDQVLSLVFGENNLEILNK